jgi:hypothetical protein
MTSRRALAVLLLAMFILVILWIGPILYRGVISAISRLKLPCRGCQLPTRGGQCGRSAI